MIIKTYLLPAILFFGSAFSGWGAVPSPAPLTRIDRALVMKAASGVNTNLFPNAELVLLDSYIAAAYDAEGLSVTASDEYVKVLTEKGRRDAGSHSFHFTLPYDEVEILAAEIISREGAVNTVDVDAMSRVMVEPGQMRSNIYNPNQKVLKLSLPGVEIGDVIRLQTLRRTVKPRVPGTWADYQLFEYTMPILRAVYEVRAPRDLPLTHRVLRSPVADSMRYESHPLDDGGTLHRWKAMGVPRMYREPDMPPLHTVVQRLLVSTIPDWETISRWYWELSLPHLQAVTDEMREVVDAFKASADTREDLLGSLFTFVSQKIRYMGVTAEKEAPGYEPRDTGTTFSRRYGVCRDKAALLVSMLRLAEIPAYPVLIHTGARKDEEAPQPFFNHAIVAAEDEHGEYILLDPTSEITRERLPAQLCNRSYLVAHPDGEKLRVSPVFPAEVNLARIRTVAEFGDDDRLLVTSTLELDGINDSMYRGHLARLKPEQRRLFFEGLFNARMSGGLLTDLVVSPSDLSDTSQPLRISLRGYGPNILERKGGRAMIDLPWLGNAIGYANYAVGGTGLKKRSFPLETRATCAVDEELSITLPDGVEPAALPADVHRRIPGLSLEQSITIHDKRKLTARHAFSIEAPEFAPESYPEVKGLLAEREFAYRSRPLMVAESSARQADARVQRASTSVTVADDRSWSIEQHVKQQVLSFAGQQRLAELSFHYNPAWQEVELISATVSNRDGRVHHVDADAINIMDASWTGAAPRYPPERILIVNLPALEPGSVIEYRIRREQREAAFFSLRHVFGGADPVENAALRVETPRDYPLRYQIENGGLNYRAETNDAAIIRTWRGRDFPAGHGEDHLPPAWGFAPAVFASGGDWKQYAALLRKEVERAAESPAVRSRGSELTRNVTDPREKLRIIRDFVARAVRPAGPSFRDLPLHISDAGQTLRDGYGHGADRAAVILAMVKGAGINDVRVVAAASKAPIPRTLLDPLLKMPQRDLFDSLLVEVSLEGERIWLNDTDQYAPLGVTRNARRVYLTPEGGVDRITPSDGFATAESAFWNLKVFSDGAVAISLTNFYFGEACADFRKRYGEMPPEERRRHLQELAGRVSRSAEAEGGLDTDLLAYPGVRTFSLRAHPYVTRQGNLFILDLPEAGHTYPRIRGDRRQQPMLMEELTTVTRRWRVELPAETTSLVMMPEEETIVLPGGLGTLKVTTSSRRTPGGSLMVTIQEEQRRSPGFLYPDLYPALRAIDLNLRSPRRKVLVFEMDR